jgi:SAM-dependent methyltransferase
MPENTSATAPLYAELPYPGDGVVRTTIARVAVAGLRSRAPHLLEKQKLRIIDVGCGTGETTAGIARFFPQAEVVGLDVNPASLELAAKLARDERLNIRFLQCNVLEDPAAVLRDAGLLADDRRFDLMFSIGVLHHLPDPPSGFRNVRPLIADDGRFLAFMYSMFGRWRDTAVIRLLDQAYDPTEFAARAEAIRLLKLSTKHTWRGFLEGLSTRIRYGLPISPLEMARTHWKRRKLVHVSDTFSNPCETYSTFAELEEIARATGWQVPGLAERGGLPTDAESYTRDPQVLRALQHLPRAALFDYFAFIYRASGFLYWLAPAE